MAIQNPDGRQERLQPRRAVQAGAGCMGVQARRLATAKLDLKLLPTQDTGDNHFMIYPMPILTYSMLNRP